jgi:hypothetical protein
LDQETGGPLRNGVNRFECLLQPFGLGGKLDDRTQKVLFELSQVRHVLVHRRRFADRRLLDACPWLSLTSGSKVKITNDMWSEYQKAVAEYLVEIIQRVRVHSGLPRYVRKDESNAQAKDANQP